MHCTFEYPLSYLQLHIHLQSFDPLSIAAAAKSLQSCLFCATPQMAAHQTPSSLGFSRQEHWSGLPFPSPMHESGVAQSCPTLLNPMDCSLPGSSVHGIFQARVLEWGAIAFSAHWALVFLKCTRNSSVPLTWLICSFCLRNSCTTYWISFKLQLKVFLSLNSDLTVCIPPV